jgi:hypothetical protein
MPGQLALYVFFILGTLVGYIHTYSLLKSAPIPIQRPDIIFEWQEKPLSEWKYEPFSKSVILLHTLAILALSSIAIHATSNPGYDLSLTGNMIIIFMDWFSQYGSMALIGYLLGAMIFSLLKVRKTISYSIITETGVTSGKIMLPWHYFSHFTMDNQNRILRLFSAFSPDLQTAITKIPGSISLTEVSNTLQKFLPDHPPEGRHAWYRTKFMLVPAMLLVCLPLLVLGWLASSLPRSLALFALVSITVLVVYLGQRVVVLFAFGKQGKRKNA